MTDLTLEPIARIQWTDPTTRTSREFILYEGATISIGRASTNDIQISQEHVSRQHAVIRYRDGFFMINDLASSNGTFVNDEQIQAPVPLVAGDTIRLFEPTLKFLACDEDSISQDSQIMLAAKADAQASLIVTNGPQEGQTIALLLDDLQVGRATSKATWQILLQDPSVSRPHARLHRRLGRWYITDLASSNGTRVNHKVLQPDDETALFDGDKVEFGGSILLFRLGLQHANRPGSASSDSLTYALDD